MSEIGSYTDRALLRTRAMPLRTIFWISLREGLPGILLRKSLVPFFTRPSAPITAGIVLALRCHILPISISKSILGELFKGFG